MRKLAALATTFLMLAGPAGAAGFGGTWSGTYLCAQGETRLDLFIQAPADGPPTALFHFGDGSPERPEGCFAMQGTLTNGMLAFTATHWLLQPDGYVTVNLIGTAEADSYAGQVFGPGCGSFTLQRQAAAPIPTACRQPGDAVS